MMLIQHNCKYIYILTFSALSVFASSPVFAQADTTSTDTASDHKVKKIDSAGHQLCFGIDIVRPIINYYASDYFGYEFEADYYLRNEFYGVAEGGWGGSTVNYANLQYNTTNTFIRLGFNKTILPRVNPRDWDMMFFGLRAGVADVNRGKANFTIVDSVWGNVPNQTTGSQNFIAYWAELTGGMRVELLKGLFAGWTARGKFLMDGKSFNGLSPLYIAGYGRGDKNANFDMNVFISYAVRWKRKSLYDTGKATIQPIPPGEKNNADTTKAAIQPIPPGDK